jgi:hypothetical protein
VLVASVGQAVRAMLLPAAQVQQELLVASVARHMLAG